MGSIDELPLLPSTATDRNTLFSKQRISTTEINDSMRQTIDNEQKADDVDSIQYQNEYVERQGGLKKNDSVFSDFGGHQTMPNISRIRMQVD